jgi:hypothetical protein
VSPKADSFQIHARPIPWALHQIGQYTLPDYPLAWVLKGWML